MTDKEYLAALGVKISELRQAKGISQIELARRLETGGNNQIRRIEKGLTNPTILTLRRIAKELETTIDLLLRI